MAKTFDIINAYELRDLAIAAAQATRGVVKVKFPQKGGGLIQIEYNEIKDLFNFAKAWGVLNWQLNPDLRIALRKAVDCEFFCCANCRIVGKEHRHKVFISLCNKCGIEYNIVQDERTAKFWADFDLRNAPKIKDEPIIEEPIRPPEPVKEKPKLVSPVKLKFNDKEVKDKLKIKTPPKK